MTRPPAHPGRPHLTSAPANAPKPNLARLLCQVGTDRTALSPWSRFWYVGCNGQIGRADWFSQCRKPGFMTNLEGRSGVKATLDWLAAAGTQFSPSRGRSGCAQLSHY